MKGRLGLDTARVPHSDRHGLVWLSRGALVVREGTLRFVRDVPPDATSALGEGDYAIPFQTISAILLGPGSTVSHDALRLMARHGTILVAVGEDGVRCYTAPPLGPDNSVIARRHVELWADPDRRMAVALRMYEIRIGEPVAGRSLEVLRGIEGAHAKRSYQIAASRHGIIWRGRRYDRMAPLAADIPNQAINHASVAVTAAAAVAVASTRAIPALGFIHEASGEAFVLDIADLVRDTVTVPAAFTAARLLEVEPTRNVERTVRRTVGARIRDERVIPKMIDFIHDLIGEESGT